MKKARQIILLVGIVLMNASSYAQPSFQWAKSVTDPVNSVSGQGIAVDNLGNSYAIGAFQGTIDVDPGAPVNNITSSGSWDIFLQKLDASGNLVWAVKMGGSGLDLARNVKIAPSGDIYVVGVFNATASFGPFNLVSAGGQDSFFAKISPTGTFLWAKRVGAGETWGESCYDLDFDNSGNIYLGGTFSGTVDFNPGSGTYNVTSVGNDPDGYLLKLNSNGDFVWVLTTGGTSSTDKTICVDVDQNGNIYAAGAFGGTVDLDPTGGIDNYTASVADVFIQKISPSGAYLWGTSIEGAGTLFPTDIMTDDNNNLLTLGWLTNTVDLDPGAGANIVPTAGGFDVFLIKLDPNGNYINGLTMGSAGNDIAYTMDLDTAGNTIYSGRFEGTTDFDPGIGVNNITSNGSNDCFVSKLDPSGNFLWAINVGGSGDEATTGIAVNNSDEILYTGVFASTVDFDHGSGTDFHTTAAAEGYFVCKLGQCAASFSTINPVACGSYVSPSGNYTWTTSNTYMDTIPSSTNCDSIITINLTINQPTAGTDVVTACDSYTWIDNNTYTSNNTTATHTLVNGNYNGCDSVVTLNLTINNSTAGTDIVTACDSYTWIDNNTYTSNNTTATHTLVNGNYNGCDSVVTLNLTINNSTAGTDVVTACNSYTWIDNNTYTSNNTTATHTLVNGNANGCDSVVTLNLTINTVDVSTTNNLDSITANATSATYRWLDCDNNYAVIPGETNALFVATANGNYAVEVTQNGCVDTSACVNVTSIGIEERGFSSLINIYPNPNNGLFTLEIMDFDKHNVALSIIDVTGKTIVNEMDIDEQRIGVDLTDQPKGIYFLLITSENEMVTKKLVIQ